MSRPGSRGSLSQRWKELRGIPDAPSKLERQIQGLDDGQLRQWIDQNTDTVFEAARGMRGPHGLALCREAQRALRTLSLLFDEYVKRLEQVQPPQPTKQVW